MDLYSELSQKLHREHPGLSLLRGEPLCRHTSFRIGGPAALVARPGTEEEAICCLNLAREMGIRLVILGNGTNLLAADEGVDAFFLCTGELSSLRQTGPAELTAGAGVLLSRLAAAAAQLGLAGLEFAHGIPGFLGGAVTMNAGAYGGEMAQVVTKTRYLTAEGQVRELSGDEHAFAYRHSFFSEGGGVILSSSLSLQAGEKENIHRHMKALAEKRRTSQPLEYPSAGSLFRRPPGHYAAALIDECGLKGFTVGGAQISQKHAGFAINCGGATCRDVLELADRVREEVLRRTGVALELEVKHLR